MQDWRLLLLHTQLGKHTPTAKALPSIRVHAFGGRWPGVCVTKAPAAAMLGLPNSVRELPIRLPLSLSRAAGQIQAVAD